MASSHRCDEHCVCPADGKPLFFHRATGDHACQDPDCVNAHGIVQPWLDGRVTSIDMTYEVDDLDRMITEKIQSSVQKQFEFTAPAVTLESLLEVSRSVDLIRQQVEAQQRADLRRVEEAYARAIELGQGVFIATRQGRVVYAEASAFVDAGKAYWANTDAWGQMAPSVFGADSYAPRMSDYDPIIDQ